MSKRIFYSIILFCASISFEIEAQNTHWQGVTPSWQVYTTNTFYEDSAVDRLYLGGYTSNGFCYYDGNSIVPMGNVLCSGGIREIVKYNDTLYVSAFCNGHFLSKWNGTNWDTTGISANGMIWALYVYNGELYAGGQFTIIGGVNANCLAKYNGVSWSPVGNYPGNSNYISQEVNAITFYNGELYVGGLIVDSVWNQTNLLRWNGTNWGNVGQGLHGSFAFVEALEVYNNDLYIGGSFRASEGNPGDYIVKWDGTTLSDVGGGVMGNNYTNGQIHDLMTYNNSLYAAGAFSYAGGVFAQYIAKWDGVNWCGFGDTLHNKVVSLATFRGDLYIGGAWWIIGTDTLAGAAKWIGGSYVDTCGNMTGINENRLNNFSVQIIPNPINQNGIFQFTGLEGNKTLIIYDQLGREIWRKEIGESQIEFSSEGFSLGMYFYRVEESERMVAQGKFIVQ